MNQSEAYETFFKRLSAELKSPLTLVLTGGAAAFLFGGSRPTLDLDFSAQPSKASAWDETAALLNRMSEELKLPVQYSEDISRWSMISLLDWREHTLLYKKYGKLEVRLLHPKHWSIGKISRGYDTDFEDIKVVLKLKNIPYEEIVPFWAQALRDSEPSSEVFQAKKLIEEFLKDYGKAIWGKDFDAKAALALFADGMAKGKKT